MPNIIEGLFLSFKSEVNFFSTFRLLFPYEWVVKRLWRHFNNKLHPKFSSASFLIAITQIYPLLPKLFGWIENLHFDWMLLKLTWVGGSGKLIGSTSSDHKDSFRKISGVWQNFRIFWTKVPEKVKIRSFINPSWDYDH